MNDDLDAFQKHPGFVRGLLVLWRYRDRVPFARLHLLGVALVAAGTLRLVWVLGRACL